MLKHDPRELTLDTITINGISYRFGKEDDRENILRLQWDCHSDNPDYFFPFLKKSDDLTYKPEDCALTFVRDQLAAVGYADMESEDFQELAKRVEIPWRDTGEIGVFTNQKFRKLGLAANATIRAIKYLEQQKKRYALFESHPQNFSMKTPIMLGARQIGESFYPSEGHPPRIILVAEVEKALNVALEKR